MNSKIKEALEHSNVSKDSQGNFYVELYADYRDVLDDDTIVKIVQADNPEDALFEEIADAYVDSDAFIYSNLKDEVIKYINTHYPNENVDEEYVLDYLYDNTYTKYPMEHYLKQKSLVTILLDTGDGNYDYVLNCVYPHYNGSKGETLDDKASIAWLARQQGYTKQALKNALYNCEYNNSDFLKSMRTEVLNMSTHMATMAFLVSLTLEDLIRINKLIKIQDVNGHKYDATKNPYCGYIVLDKNVMAGLYDPWSGGGSVLEVELDKDVKIPAKYIRSALPDGADGYSIESVYGMSKSAWKNNIVKTIHTPVKYR